VRRSLWALVCSVLLASALPGSARGAEKVDVILVLASDVSRSVTDDKFVLQRRGYAEALTDKRVLHTIAEGEHGKIALMFIEWAGASDQRVVVEWSLIRTVEDAVGFAGKLSEAPRSFMGLTAIGSAIEFSARQIANAPYQSDRKVIDVSGDGISNGGLNTRAARDAALNGSVTTINGIVILTDPTTVPPDMDAHTNPPGGLASYYRDDVIGGSGSFVTTAEGFEAFGRSLVLKLMREIS
jgi:hypothetical protein